MSNYRSVKRKKKKIFPAVSLILILVLLLGLAFSVFGWMNAKKNAEKQVIEISKKLEAAEKALEEKDQKIETTTKEVVSMKTKVSEMQAQIEQLEKDYSNAIDESQKLKVENDRLKILQGLESDDMKLVALTFDDGPSAPVDRLLKLLEEKKMKATFFVLGSNVEKRPKLAKQIVDKGHEIGNHSYIHKNFKSMSIKEIEADLLKSHNAIKKATGASSRLIRTPYGIASDNIKKVCENQEWRNIYWSVDTLDWKSRDAKKIYETAFQDGTHGVRDGAIVLMHDVFDVYVDGAELIMDRLEKENYVTVTISQMLALRAKDGVAGKKYFDFFPKK